MPNQTYPGYLKCNAQTFMPRFTGFDGHILLQRGATLKFDHCLIKFYDGAYFSELIMIW